MSLNYDPNWKRPVKNDNAWYNTLTEYEDTLDASKYFKVEVVDAKTKIIKKNKVDNSSETHTFRYEILNLVLKIDGTNFYLPNTIGIFAHTKKDDGDWSSDSVQLHDFLSIALEQNPNALEDSYEYEDMYQSGWVYPNLVGTKLICVMAQTGIRQTNKGNYPEYSFALFDEKGYTVVEKEQKDKSRNSLRLAMEELNKKYREFMGEDVTSENEVTENPDNSTVEDDDDLPF